MEAKQDNLFLKELLTKGFKFHTQGNLLEAEKIYKLLLDQGCNHPGVFSNYGVICKNKGETNKAIKLYQKSILLNPPKILPKESNMKRGKHTFKIGINFIKMGSRTNNLFLITALTIFFASFSVLSIGIKIGSLTPSNIPVFTKAGQTAVMPI